MAFQMNLQEISLPLIQIQYFLLMKRFTGPIVFTGTILFLIHLDNFAYSECKMSFIILIFIMKKSNTVMSKNKSDIADDL